MSGKGTGESASQRILKRLGRAPLEQAKARRVESSECASGRSDCANERQQQQRLQGSEHEHGEAAECIEEIEQAMHLDFFKLYPPSVLLGSGCLRRPSVCAVRLRGNGCP